MAKCDHKFVQVKLVKEWETTIGEKKIFKKTASFKCPECDKLEQATQFEHALAPPAWWTRDGREN